MNHSDRHKSFYENIDRDKQYTVEKKADNHPFYALLVTFIKKYNLKNKKCLEIGSSKGLFQDLVIDYSGVDIAKNLSKYYHKPFFPVSGPILPFPDDYFDAIFTYAVHEHIPEVETACEEIIRVLKPGGVCLFAPAWHTRSWFAQGYAVRPYSNLSLREKLIKLSIPFRDFFPMRYSLIFLRRFFNLLMYISVPQDTPLRYKRLSANYEKFWQSDSDACNSLDPFDLVLWFKSRGIICHGYNSMASTFIIKTYAIEIEK